MQCFGNMYASAYKTVVGGIFGLSHIRTIFDEVVHKRRYVKGGGSRVYSKRQLSNETTCMCRD